MATAARVLALLGDVREASGFPRARAVASALQAFAELGPEQKRDLAVLVAERSAPHLVPRIEAETGLDLSREQVQAVLDMATRMDGDDLVELQHAVHDRESRGAALRSIGTAATAAAATATGLDDVLATPDPDVAPPGHPAVADDTADVPGVPQDELDALGVEADLVELDAEPAPSVEVRPAPEPRPFVSIFDTLPDAFADVAPAEPPVAPAPDPTPPPPVPARPEPVLVPSPSPAPDAVPGPAPDLTSRVRAAREPIVEALRDATSDAARLRLLRRRVDELADTTSLARAAVVDAIPDGWARRRALEALLAAEVLTAAELPALVRRVGSPIARQWVCASAIEAGMLIVDDAAGLLDDRAAGRLARRYG